jgi:hypothetical protein
MSAPRFARNEHDVTAAAATTWLGSPAWQGGDGCAKEGFDPLLVLADPQAPPDEPRRNGVDDAAECEAAA